MPEKKPFERLPTTVAPSNYKLQLEPNLADFTFKGSAEVALDVKESTNKIVLNSVEIKVQSVSYSSAGQATDISYDADQETVTFLFAEPLKVGSGVLSIKFTGELNDKMKGFYRNKYTTPDGKEKFGATTQFEATDARRAFPCWDEPAVKATFDVTLVVPKGLVALSNMSVKSETACPTDESKSVMKYDTTPIMSTYLLAAVIGEYDYIEDKDSDGVLVRVYTPVGKKEQGRFALEVAVKTLPFYKNYFSIAYPLPKLDLIAIQDFAAGAMENWGLVTYRETALLVDPENSSAAARQWVALVVGHEIAHQWFGNLVTMEWWTHLWLNEGFASWIEYLCVDHCFPEYDIWTQFASTDFTKALELDALNSSHPIEVPVGHPAEVDEIFDAISYSKGASVIRMLHEYVGNEDFRKGLNHYLTVHQHKNAFTEDLWRSLGKVSGKPVDAIMNTWTKQMGFPVLQVSQSEENGKVVLNIKQEKFCVSKQTTGESPLWIVPVSICTSSSPNESVKTFVLEEREAKIVLDDVKPDEWIKLNCGGVGFFRCQYSSKMLDALLPGIKNKSLSPRDRLGLQNDLFALARAGIASTTDFLKVASAFEHEDNYTVWSDLATNIGVLSTIFQYTDFHEDFQKFTANLLRPISQKLGWDCKPGESHLDCMLRSVVLRMLGHNGDSDTIAEAQKRLQVHCDKSCSLTADLRATVYTTCLMHGGQDTFDAMLKLFRETDLHEEKVRVMRSLGSVKTEKLIQDVLEFAMGDEVRSQDTVFVIAGVTSSVLGREKAWKFLQDRWNDLHERYQGGFLLSRLVKRTTEDFVTEERANEIKAFFDTHSAPAAERTIQQSLETIEINRRQLAADAQAVKQFLQATN